MSAFFYRRARVGPGEVVFAGETEVGWRAPREETNARIDEVEATCAD